MLHMLLMQGQQTQHPAFQHVVNPNRGAPNRHQVRGGVKPGAYPRPAYDQGYRNVNKRKARRGDEIVYPRKQGQYQMHVTCICMTKKRCICSHDTYFLSLHMCTSRST